MKKNYERATLILEDGSIFSGYSFGYVGKTDGEVVFNTGMVGYPETLTDPSYAGQILVATYPLMGNYGVPPKTYDKTLLVHFESDKIQAKALIVADYSENYSHWNAERSLSDWMEEEKIPGIFGIDTRALTRKLRDSGTMLGKIIPGDDVTEADLNKKIEDPMKTDLVGSVCTKEVVEYEGGKTKIVLVDCGVKNNIIRAFQGRDISVVRVPYDYDFTDIEADGVMISNGPGDPKMCQATVENTKRTMDKGIPTLGVCLGSQIIGLAAGMETYKLKYGHRSLNQPVNEAGTNRSYITSQNHGYAVDAETMPLDWREWFTNDNDGSNEGIIHISKPFFGTQFHPEASPGPDDTEFIFDMFVRSLK